MSVTTIKEKVYDINLVVKDIIEFPQTYNTILKECNSDGTCQFILRRKINKLCKQGIVCKTNIPGTRFGQVIFYVYPKKYSILIESSRLGSNVYCFFDYKKISKYYMKVSECWHLKNNDWIKIEEKIFFEGNILKFI